MTEAKMQENMHNPTQSDSGPNPVPKETTERLPDTKPDSPPAQREAASQGERNKSVSAAETETPILQQENRTGAEAPASMAVTPAVENEPAVQPSDSTGGKELDRKKTNVPIDPVPEVHANPGRNGEKAKKPDKGVRDGRKYVPSKKAMIDPLKMDMSKPAVIPLTSSQLSLQCIECHIIFSDHKSKERHLKLSHPAEYEQCILRNALFACYVCDRHFTNSTELMAHQKAHKEKKPFKCPICGQAFGKSSELTVHKKVHFGLDGYACTDCGKPCKTMTLLKYHRRTHTGERPYICKECGKRFTMSKALQKHMVAHLPEGAEEDGGGVTKKRQLKKDGSTIKYPCSVCKATFKSTKTQLHHMKTKHKMLPNADKNASAHGQLKQNTPIITPISICQPGLLQLEPNGPLQKVDANIDTEQICRLIESLGNVQKVNQVVVLGQVPPHAPPLEVQQIPQLAGPVNLNFNPPQIDFMGMKRTDSQTNELDTSNTTCDPMEQTIILEPITPDGRPDNSCFSLGSHIGAGDNIALTLVQSEQIQGEMMHQILPQPDISGVQSDNMGQVICQDDSDVLKENLEQTVILELTPALIPTVELEQSQTIPQNEILSSVLVPTTELGKIPDQPSIGEQEKGMSVPLLHTVELELTPLQTEQQELPPCPFVPSNTLTQTPSESETHSKEEVNSQMQTESLVQVQPVLDGEHLEETQEKTEQEASEKLLEESKEDKELVKELSEEEGPSTKEKVLSQVDTKQVDTKQVPQITQIPLNVMSAQELVKVRKRKPARAFIFQGYMQELIGSIHKDDLHMNPKPAKRQKTKKSHLVVKFSPKSKEKKKREKKPSKQRKQALEDVIISKVPLLTASEKKGPSQKKGSKGKSAKKAGHFVSPIKNNPSSSPQDSQVHQVQEDKGKKKKPKEVVPESVTNSSEYKTVAPPVFKKKKQAKIMQKDQPKNAKERKLKKNLARDKKNKAGKASGDTPGPHITQDALLLLKGHKQPQLKVHKLDTSKASGRTQESSAQESQILTQQSKNEKLKHPTSEFTNDLTPDAKKKGGRPKKNQKALSLLPQLQVSHQPPATMPTKPKTTRKRKASSKVETEGVITSNNSKRALECKDCGERFSEVSSLQKHKATVHIVESPGLTYTNGNIFEGVSRLDLYQLPKQHPKVVGLMNAAADWDTEPEIGEMALEDREPCVSFPALIPSPSLPVPPSDVEMNVFEEKSTRKRGADGQSHISTDLHLSSEQTKNCENRQMPSSETGEPLTSGVDKQEVDPLVSPISQAEVHGATDEDIKEDLLLEVDLVTVGEQSERDDPAFHEDTFPQNESNGTCTSQGETTMQPSNETEISLILQTVSCSPHQREIKAEEEEITVQKKKGGKKAGARNATKRRGTGHQSDAVPKRGLFGDAVGKMPSEKEQQVCQVVYEKPSHSEINEESQAGTENSKPESFQEFEAKKSTTPATSSPSMPSLIEESPEEQVVFELKSVTTSVEEVINDRRLQGGEEINRDQSPGIILEKFLTSRQQTTADKDLCLIPGSDRQRQGWDSMAENEVQIIGSQEIKVEESTSDPPLAASCQNRQSAIVQPQHHRDIRTVLVKEESTLVLNEVQVAQGSRHIRWNVEPVNMESSSCPFTENSETTRECRLTPEFNTSQCIFYPVKEEEREVLLGASHTTNGTLTTGTSSSTQQTIHQATDCDLDEGIPSGPDYQKMRVRGLLSGAGVSDFGYGQAEEDTDLQQPPDLQHFLLQSTDEEDVGGLELSDPHLHAEAEVMAYFDKDQTSNPQQPDEMSPNFPTSTSQPQTPRADNTREPIDYFSEYFGWETWLEIASSTIKLSNKPNAVTAKEVAQFVGIHIAMGTLKFPSPRLYWEDSTKVPLIAEAMPLARFLELLRILKLASSPKDAFNSHIREGRQDGPNFQQEKHVSGAQNAFSQHSSGCGQGDTLYELSSSRTQTDPLWKVQPLLCRFKAGCQSLRRDSDYAVDQYPLPLAEKMHNKKPSLYCTTLIGYGGFLLHVDLKLCLSGKEDAVEKMVPQGSMVFLCKQELSTPAMLERLLAAGVHGAGRVGGARGQIGDEFVSSDGKLMLRRSHCGFILSTAGNSQRNMASLTENFEKAQMSAQLNIDLQNLYSTPLTASASTCWPHAVLWYLTDLALINSWLLYKEERRSATLTLMAFRLEVSKSLILSSGSDAQDSVPPQPPKEKAHAAKDTRDPSVVEESPLPDTATRYDGSGHWPEQLGEGEAGGRCRFRDCQRTSRVLCLKCCVFLCISRNNNCFLNFHNQ